jgi:hypothetical protein
MKKFFVLFIVVVFVSLNMGAIAQPPPPPPNPSGGSNDPVGAAGAPIGNGVYILITLAAAYGSKKVYQTRKTKSVMEE